MGLIRGSYNAGKDHPCYGKRMPDSTREKIRNTLTGRTMPDDIKAKISLALKGRKFSREHLLKNSLSQVGSKNHAWKGGRSYFNTNIRQLSKYKEWRKSVFLRDNFTCCSCGVRGGELEVNHKIPFASILSEFLKSNSHLCSLMDREQLTLLAIDYQTFWDISNGEVLCKPCHRNTKSYGSKKNKESVN